VKRFADAPVIAAAADRAVATTLVTVEGRTLTEVALWIRNRAQSFMKVTLPPGAMMFSVEVAGESAKPVLGPDGIRVPLLRPGLKPGGPYMVSFVYLHAGQAFARRGEAQIALPALDVPVSVLEWELFLPDRFSVKPLGGNVTPAHLVAGIGTLTEEVQVSADAATVASRASERSDTYRPNEEQVAGDRKQNEAAQQTPSLNVQNLQRRVAGVLPVRVDVPRTGTSHRFVRPLVLEEETTVSFKYRTR
jgi:hypothetical protein